MNTIIEKLKHSLEITRSELKDVWYDDKTSVLCESLLQIERNLEEVLKSLGATGYKRAAFKTTKKIKTAKVTMNEMEIIEDIIYSDHSSDGHGLCGYLYYSNYDMKKFRGVMASLVKKGVCSFDEVDDDMIQSSPATWACILDEFQEEVEDRMEALLLPESIQKKCIEWNGYKLVNIEVA